MADKKIPTGLKLSKAALDNLAEVVRKTGMSKTAIVELGIALVARTLNGKTDPEPERESNPT